jgi:hypothetical protein
MRLARGPRSRLSGSKLPGFRMPSPFGPFLSNGREIPAWNAMENYQTNPTFMHRRFEIPSLRGGRPPLRLGDFRGYLSTRAETDGDSWNTLQFFAKRTHCVWHAWVSILKSVKSAVTQNYETNPNVPGSQISGFQISDSSGTTATARRYTGDDSGEEEGTGCDFYQTKPFRDGLNR